MQRDVHIGRYDRFEDAERAPMEGRPVQRLSELLGQHVQFAYTSVDRIVLNGYIERLQRPAGLVAFFHEGVGIRWVRYRVADWGFRAV